jgi:hypothetical protein
MPHLDPDDLEHLFTSYRYYKKRYFQMLKENKKYRRDIKALRRMIDAMETDIYKLYYGDGSTNAANAPASIGQTQNGILES